MTLPPHRRVRLALLVSTVMSTAIMLLAIASPALAQPKVKKEDPSFWGVNVSFAPGWELSDQVKNLLGAEDNEIVNFSGNEFTIGFVRGSRLGGDWGVSFVRKPFDDGSGVTETDQDCFNNAQTICRPRIKTSLTRGMTLTGVEVHWFIRFVTIKERAQIGLNLAGGIASPSGEVVITTDSFQPTGFNQNGPTGFTPVHEVEVSESKDEFLPYWPLGKVEVVGSLIAAPKFKVQAAYGLNFPAISWRIMGVAFF